MSRSRKVTTLMATQARAQLWGQELRVELYSAVASGETSSGTRATATLKLLLSILVLALRELQ